MNGIARENLAGIEPAALIWTLFQRHYSQTNFLIPNTAARVLPFLLILEKDLSSYPEVDTIQFFPREPTIVQSPEAVESSLAKKKQHKIDYIYMATFPSPKGSCFCTFPLVSVGLLRYRIMRQGIFREGFLSYPFDHQRCG